jgi:hypothetical protein
MYNELLKILMVVLSRSRTPILPSLSSTKHRVIADFELSLEFRKVNDLEIKKLL